MTLRKFILPILALIFSSLACRAAETLVLGAPSPTLSPSATLTPEPTSTLAPTTTPTAIPTLTFEEACPNGDCIEICLENLGINLVNESPFSHRDPDFAGRGGQILVSYPVVGSRLGTRQVMTVYENFKTYQEDFELHQQIWDYYRTIIPAEYRRTLSSFLIFTDGKERILAYVAQSSESPAKWVLSVDVVDAQTPQDLTYTLIHEFAHLLTLGPGQVVPSDAIFEDPGDKKIRREEYEACETYFPGEGCSLPDSYIDAFYATFWDELFREWLRIQSQPDPETYIRLIEEFFLVYQDRFVTDYAVSSPEEDIAESFTFFVLTSKPEEGKIISDQKILFFYNYPELVSLRLDIIEQICGYAP